MPTPLRLSGLLVKAEVTYATDPTPTAGANGVRIMGNAWEAITVDNAFPNRREDDLTGTLRHRAAATPKGAMATLDFGVRIKGFGGAYSASNKPEGHGALLPACGLGETIVTTGGSESITLTPADSSFASVTCWAYGGGKLFKVVGCRGTYTLNFLPGQLPFIRYRMQGMILSAAEPTQTSLASITYVSTPEEPAAVSLALSHGAWTPANIGSFVFEGGVGIEMSDDVQAATGIEGFDVVDHNPKSVTEGYEETLSNLAAYDDAEPATARTLVLTLGSTQYNRFKITGGTGYLQKPPEHISRKGFAGWRAGYDYTAYNLVWD